MRTWDKESNLSKIIQLEQQLDIETWFLRNCVISYKWSLKMKEIKMMKYVSCKKHNKEYVAY